MRAVEALLTGLIDYAGLFPPAGEDMRPALENYAGYLNGPDRWALGRFIVPVTRLSELEDAAGDLLPRGRSDEPWQLAVLTADDIPAAVKQIEEFNRRHEPGSKRGQAIVDVVELKASTGDQIIGRRRELPETLTAYFELPLGGNVAPLVERLAHAGARAKMRTGGIAVDAFPRADSIVSFLVACRDKSVPFKATAGLHHPVGGEYRLTYEPDPPRGSMYGYLNVFLAAAFIYHGADEETALSLIEEHGPSTFEFADDGIKWRGKLLSAEQLAAARAEFAIAFGSCSFREPVDELTHLTRQQRVTDK